MDKIWYRNPSKSEVIGRCDGDEKKRMIMQNRQKVKCLKNKNNCNFSDNQNLCTGIEVIVSLA